MNHRPTSDEELPLAELLSLLGGEVAAPLSLALERLQAALAARQPAESALLAVREPLRRARDASLMASQVGRLASGRVQPARETCALHVLLRQVVEQRQREAQSRGLQLRLDCHDAEIASDAALLTSLLQSLLDWALTHTRSSIELKLTLSAWPAQARLSCRFALRDLDQQASHAPATLDGLRWQLLSHTAAALGVKLQREDEAGVCVAGLDFPLLQSSELQTLVPEAEPDPSAHDTQPFAGWAALLVSADEAFQRELVALMEPQGWALDHVHSIDDGFQHVVEALPQVIVVDGRLAGADLDQWRAHVLAEAPGFCFIEVRPQAAGAAADDALQCSRAEIATALPRLLRGALSPRELGLTFRL